MRSASERCLLSIVIVNWNGADHLARCLESVRLDLEREAQGDVEVIVVDNGSGDHAVREIRRAASWAQIVALETNVGFAAGANAGIRVAKGDWVGLLNNDARLEAGWIRSMQRAAGRAARDVGMLQSCIVRDDDPDRIDTAGVAIWKGGAIQDRARDRRRDEVDRSERLFCASAGAACYRREMLVEVSADSGPFDPSYFMYFEDVDLGWRSRLAGWSAEYVPDAVVRHVRHGSAAMHSDGFVKRQCAQNRLRVILGNASWRYLLGSTPRLLKDVGILLLDSRIGAIRPIGRALGGGFRARRSAAPRVRRARRSLERKWFFPR